MGIRSKEGAPCPLKKLVSLVLAALVAAPLLQAGPTFSLKLYGGAGLWLNGGDFKTLFGSTLDRWKSSATRGRSDQNWQPLAYEAGLQAVLMVDKTWGWPWASGYLAKSVIQTPSLK